MITIHRSNTILKADPERVVLLYNSLGMGTYITGNRTEKLVHRVLKLTETEIEILYSQIQKAFNHRHRNLDVVFIKHYHKIQNYLPPGIQISETRKLVLGAHFTKEYSIQSAALFNPSIVAHPDQSNVKDGELRFIISLRSVGEGHISSIEFREGIISRDGQISLEASTTFASSAEKDEALTYNKTQVKKRIAIDKDLNPEIFDVLPEGFTLQDYLMAFEKGTFSGFDEYSQNFLSEFLDTNYNIQTDANAPLNESVIFPNANKESKGMEDVRFVAFTHDDGRKEYIGTYTAYDGHQITPQLIMTDDFINFRVRTMFGPAVSDKGFAIFPEKINSKYVMAARQGGEDLTIMTSDNLYNWNNYKVIMRPQYKWGLIQQGNCGSPIKTDKGWLLITHAVGPVRKYVISAILLDLEQPEKIIGKLILPLIEPSESEREGYVPNVVYSCGALLHNDHLIIPYAMSDSATSFATATLSEILNNMEV